MDLKQPLNMKVDLSKIDKVGCIKCNCLNFTMLGTIKLISPIQSSSGKYDTAIEAKWVCADCKYPFNVQEHLDKQRKELFDAQNKRADA